MKLLVLAAWLSVATTVDGLSTLNAQSIPQFGKMISCLIPSMSPLKFNKYGCYCGIGGYGTPVDELDRCCLTHDNCYGQAAKLGHCSSLLDHPYFKWYSYSCTKSKVVCSSKNNPCEDFLCHCDLAAAICFSKVPYNEEYKNLDRNKYCKP
ncbi:phospholipase A2-like [Sorex araneus]|uniref:phospholipase A2-like n=1 Tax=Sorex araneus TaxID=42254 RepID=UPI002433C415|nr:phospholipase A2-like [Sorex araneus]